MTDTKHKSRLFGEMTVSEFIEKIASNEPVPGGGSVAAFAGAVAASLTEMVATLTIGKKGYETCEERMKALAGRARRFREKLTEDIQRDADAFDGVMAAFQLPRKTDAESVHRQQAIQNALKTAASVPLDVAKDALDILDGAAAAVSDGNKNAVTDGAVAVMMARTAVLSALYNVKINLQTIKDKSFNATMAAQVEELERKAVEKEREVFLRMDQTLGAENKSQKKV